MKLNDSSGFVRLRSPAYLNLELTDRCNWKCEFCSVAGKKETTNNCTYQPLKKFKNIIDELRKAEVFEINMFGGEPFLHPNAVDIAEYLHDSGFEVTFVSNGALIKRDTIEKISNYISAGSVSIHGFENTHDSVTGVKGSYDKAINAVNLISEGGINTGVCYTLTNKNKEEMEGFGNYVLDNSAIGYFGVNRFVPQGRGVERRKELELSVQDFNHSLGELNELKQTHQKQKIEITDGFPFCLIEDEKLEDLIKPCTSGVSFGSVNEHGDVKICSSSKYSVGNIFETSLEDVWQNSPELNRYRSLQWLDDSCKECAKFERCLSGCKVTQNQHYSSDVLVKENDVYAKT